MRSARFFQIAADKLFMDRAVTGSHYCDNNQVATAPVLTFLLHCGSAKCGPFFLGRAIDPRNRKSRLPH